MLYCVQSVQLGTLTSVQFINGSVENWKVKRKHSNINWVPLIHKKFLEYGIDTCLQNISYMFTKVFPVPSVLGIELLLLLHNSLPINKFSILIYHLLSLGIYHS